MSRTVVLFTIFIACVAQNDVPTLVVRRNGPDLFTAGITSSAQVGASSTSTFKLLNIGTFAQQWSVTVNNPTTAHWASFAPHNGTLEGGANVTVVATLAAKVDLVPQLYVGTALLNDANVIPLSLTIMSPWGLLAVPTQVGVRLTPDAPVRSSFLLVMAAQANVLAYNVSVGKSCNVRIFLDNTTKSGTLPVGTQQTVGFVVEPSDETFAEDPLRAPYVCALVISTDYSDAKSVVSILAETHPGAPNATLSYVEIQKELVAGDQASEVVVRARDKLGNARTTGSNVVVRADVFRSDTFVVQVVAVDKGDGTFALRLGALPASAYTLRVRMDEEPVGNGTFALVVVPVACPFAYEPDDARGETCVCAAGHAGDGCPPCPVGFYKEEQGNGACVACPKTLSTQNTSSVHAASCVCLPGTYAVDANVSSCAPCPDGGVCRGVNTMIGDIEAQPGRWRYSAAVAAFEKCKTPHGVQICAGGVNSSCSAGQTGPWCASCETGYGKNGKRCVACSSNSKNDAATFAFSIITAAGVVGWILQWKLRKEKRQALAYRERALGDDVSALPNPTAEKATFGERMKETESVRVVMGVFKIFVTWLQTSSLALQFNISMSNEFQRMFESQEVAQVSPWRFATFNCFVPVPYMQKYILNALTPIYCAAFSALVVCVPMMHKHFIKNEKQDWNTVRIAFFGGFEMLLFMTYTSVSFHIMTAFNCVSVGPGGGSVLFSDPSFSCDTPTHKSLVVLGGILYVLYCVGIPTHVAFTLWWVKRKHAKKLAGRRVSFTMGFFYLDKKPGAYNYELVVAFRKLSLVTLIATMNDTPGYQVVVAATLAWMYFAINIKFAPFTSKIVTDAETATLLVCALSFTVASSYYMTATNVSPGFAEGRRAFTFAAIALNVLLMLALGSLMVRGIVGLMYNERGDIKEFLVSVFKPVVGAAAVCCQVALRRNEKVVPDNDAIEMQPKPVLERMSSKMSVNPLLLFSRRDDVEDVENSSTIM